jgi:hypothetical protein
MSRASESPAQEALDPPTGTVAARRPKRRGCLAQGCLTLLGLLTVIVLVAGALLLRVPQQLGIWPSGARLLEGTPDRTSAAAIVDQLVASGLDTTGLTLYVMPVEGQDGTLAYAVLDASAGFQFPTGSAASPLVDMFRQLTSGPTVDEARVRQVAIEYRDPGGRRLGVLTASTDVIRRFAAGEIDEATFGAELHGDVDLAAALQAATTP